MVISFAVFLNRRPGSKVPNFAQTSYSCSY